MTDMDPIQAATQLAVEVKARDLEPTDAEISSILNVSLQSRRPIFDRARAWGVVGCASLASVGSVVAIPATRAALVDTADSIGAFVSGGEAPGVSSDDSELPFVGPHAGAAGVLARSGETLLTATHPTRDGSDYERGLGRASRNSIVLAVGADLPSIGNSPDNPVKVAQTLNLDPEQWERAVKKSPIPYLLGPIGGTSRGAVVAGLTSPNVSKVRAIYDDETTTEAHVTTQAFVLVPSNLKASPVKLVGFNAAGHQIYREPIDNPYPAWPPNTDATVPEQHVKSNK